MFHCVLQFPHIARPVICIKRIQHIAVGIADIALQFLIALHDKGFNEQQNVLFSLAQRRDGNIHDAEPIKQIAAQLVFFHGLIWRNIGVGQHTNIDGNFRRSADTAHGSLLQNTQLIRTLNPRPMNGLGGRSETPYILPDFYITEENGQLHIIMNDYYLPKIIIDPTYQQIIQSGTLDKSDQEYIQKNYKEAEEIVNFISYRKSTMQKVMQYILHAQKAFFLSGPGHRTAMNNAHKRA